MDRNIFNIFADVWLVASVLSAAWVAWDITVNRRRQRMTVMAFVWPLTMLYRGLAGLFFYASLGRAVPVTARGRHGKGDKPEPPMWRAAFKGATRCGADCALGDFIGEWVGLCNWQWWPASLPLIR